MRLQIFGASPISVRVAGDAAVLNLVAGDGQSAGAGLPVPIAPSVRVLNAYGEGVAGFSVRFTVLSGGGSMTAENAVPQVQVQTLVVITGSTGVARLGSWTVGAGTNTLGATGLGLVGSPVVLTSVGVSVALDDSRWGAAVVRRMWARRAPLPPVRDESSIPFTTEPTTIALSAGNNQSAPVNTAVSVNPRVLVTGAGAVPVSGVTVTWTVTGGGGSVNPGTSVTNAQGLASTVWTMGASAGTDTMEASGNGPAQGGTVLLTESFPDSNFAGRGWYGDTGHTVVAYQGRQAAQYTWTPGQTTPGGVSGMNVLFPASETAYVEHYIAFSANWRGSQTPVGPHIIYLLSDQEIDDFTGPSDNVLTCYLENNYQAGLLLTTAFQDNQNVDPTASRLYTPFGSLTGSQVSPLEARATCGANGRQGGTGAATVTQAWDYYQDAGVSHGYYNARKLTSASVVMATGNTAWHKVGAYLQMNSIVGGIAQLDGVQRVWWDDVLIFERTTLITRTGARPTLKFRRLTIGPYIGDGSPISPNQQMWIAGLTVKTAP